MKKHCFIDLHKPKRDLLGFILYNYLHGDKTCYLILREDGYCEFPLDPKDYFQTKFYDVEKRGLEYVKGKILDVGCGAGRHTSYFLRKGFDVVAIDSDKFCIKTCKEQGIKKVFLENIIKPKIINKDKFDTIWFGGNNLGITGDLQKTKDMFNFLDRITNQNAVILGRSFEHGKNDTKINQRYHSLQRRRGIFSGIDKIRIQYKGFIGEWFYWLYISSNTLKKVLYGTNWEITKLIYDKEKINFFFVIKKSKTLATS